MPQRCHESSPRMVAGQTHVARIRAPLLLAHGPMDRRMARFLAEHLQ